MPSRNRSAVLDLIQELLVTEIGLLEGLFLVGRQSARQVTLDDLVIANYVDPYPYSDSRAPILSAIDQLQTAL